MKVSASNDAVALSLIPEAVRQQAEEDAISGPAPPPELNMERILTARYGSLVTEVPSWNIVQRLRLEGEDVAATVAEVRALLRARGRAQAAWCVGPSSPTDLVEHLLRLGMTPRRQRIPALPPPCREGVVFEYGGGHSARLAPRQ